jgi:hypothetical protein
MSQRDSLKTDLVVGGVQPPNAMGPDSLNARIARLSADIDRALTQVNAQRAPIEGWSGLPTIDQQKALGYGIEDGQRAIAELNKLVGTDIPAAYRALAKKDWPRRVKRIVPPTASAREAAKP